MSEDAMSISVTVVDDNPVDRYLVKRHLDRLEVFRETREFSNGEVFLEALFGERDRAPRDEDVRLVLMDVNMPGLNGFETIAEMHRRIVEGEESGAVVCMMFTSSNNPSDKAMAERSPLVEGLITKPIDDDAIARMIEVHAAASASSSRGQRPPP